MKKTFSFDRVSGQSKVDLGTPPKRFHLGSDASAFLLAYFLRLEWRQGPQIPAIGGRGFRRAAIYEVNKFLHI